MCKYAYVCFDTDVAIVKEIVFERIQLFHIEFYLDLKCRC